MKTWGACLVGLAVVTGALTLFLFDPARVPIYPRCVFHQLTGLNCPGCGMLRASHALLHGDVFAALRFNAFLVLSVLLFAALGAVTLWRRWQGRPGLQIKPVWWWIYLAALGVFAVARDLPLPVFATLAP